MRKDGKYRLDQGRKDHPAIRCISIIAKLVAMLMIIHFISQAYQNYRQIKLQDPQPVVVSYE